MSVPGNIPPELLAETVTRVIPTEPPTSDRSDSIPALPPVIPGYRIVRRLGGGGMGEVYEAVNEKLGVTFALKIVRADRASRALAERFRQEMRSMVGLDHAHIARIYADGEFEDRPFYTMRFARGGTLADRRREYVNKPREAIALMVKVIDAVDYLHGQGQVHRDLKPSNILIDESGQPLLSDFGLVKEVGGLFDDDGQSAEATTDGSSTRPSPVRPPDAPTLTRTGGVIGTYAYMSPEQARGKKGSVGPRTDIWALGVILFELLAGHRPGESDGVGEAAFEKVDPALAQIVKRCLSENPEGRYPSAAALATDLRRWLQAGMSKPNRRPPVVLVAALVLLAALITLAILRRDPPDKQEKLRNEARESVRKELRANRAVTLIDAEGNPKPIVQLLAKDGSSQAHHDPAGWWSVDTTAVALAVFLDDPGVDSFTLTGEVRCNWRSDIPMAGLFVAHRTVKTPDGDWHFQFEHIYDECPDNFVVPPAPPGLPVPLPKSKSYKPVGIQPGFPPAAGHRVARLHGCQLANGNGENPEEFKTWEINRDDPVEGGPWRQLGIRASGTTFSVSWGGKDEYALPEITVGKLDKMQMLIRERPDPPLQFSARGGVGVYVSGGSASFRNLTVVPGPAR
jgi:serine/threonine protein kinase